MTRFAAALCLAALAAAGAPPCRAADEPESAGETRRFQIDPGPSRLTVHTLTGGLLGGLGHDHNIGAEDFRADVRWTPGTVVPGGVRLVVRADSLGVLDDVGPKDRAKIERTMREKVLETSRFPEIVFEATEVAIVSREGDTLQLLVDGELTLHGVSRPVSVPAELTLEGNGFRAMGSVAVRQTDFGIKPVSIALGTIKVKDELTIRFDLTAR